ncbi:SDR family NAD(P)-dependent oxidoreductase [Nocardia gipuzkoensis]
MSEQTTHQKVALVTGANKGIGRGAAEQLAAQGMVVLIGARDPLRGEEAAAALRAAGGAAHAVTLDVTDRTIVAEAAKLWTRPGLGSRPTAPSGRSSPRDSSTPSGTGMSTD